MTTDGVIIKVTSRTAAIVNQLMRELEDVPEPERLRIAFKLAIRLIEAFGEAGLLAGE